MRTAALAAALLALAGCSADLQVDRVCVTSPGYTVPSARVPGVTSAPLPPVQLAFALGSTVPDLAQSGVHDVQVLFRSAALDSTQSADFVTTLTVSAVPPSGSTLPKLPLGTYQRPATGAGTSIEVTGDGAELFPYLQSGQLVLELSGTADPSQAPGGSFTAGATLCAEVKAAVSYL
ncbi:hypothetical protein [Anaeromyxobacter diazotrophicus]|uniref:Lipoprotein n=1 Tax=Anaeromyxobacter diazotrophicus TaxID=2590199 RepID=A0A7I9VH34_9BACT|nr:hypothetical protein [Anaeromyxobacter diazotrophicus]GEJ55347.1 hypothetical protein AMYX_00880 [Anaeromyxobacter diazotrophicus]